MQKEAFNQTACSLSVTMLYHRQVAASGARLLSRLRVVEAVAKFQVAGETLARLHAGNNTPDTPAAQVCNSLQIEWSHLLSPG
jgi:hypothetical protein